MIYKKKYWTLFVVAAIVFSCFFIFFTVAHPLYIYDIDDWTYISYSRQAWPSTNNWNPTRIMPETIMPLVSEIAVNLIMPFTKDYIVSMAYIFSVVLSLVITFYLLSFVNVIKKHFNLDIKIIYILMIILALLHFLPFNVNTTGNTHLLYSQNVTCYFYYILSALINAIIVMYFIMNQKLEFNKSQKLFCNGFIILAIYLSINSNLFQSIILISYVIMRLLVNLYSSVCAKDGGRYYLVNYIKNNIFEIVIFILWIFSALIELNGGRASSISSGKGLLLKDSIRAFFQSIQNINMLFVYGNMIIILASLIIYALSHKSDIDNVYIVLFIKISICLMFSVVYLVLLCSKTGAVYLKRADVMISWMYWLLMLVVISLAYIIKKLPHFTLFIPLILYILIFETAINGKTFAESNSAGYNAQLVKELDNNIIAQVEEAEKAGKDNIDVLVPVYDSSDNWPIATYGGERISDTLFRHGITRKKMVINLIPDYSINKKYNLP